MFRNGSSSSHLHAHLSTLARRRRRDDALAAAQAKRDLRAAKMLRIKAKRAAAELAKRPQ